MRGSMQWSRLLGWRVVLRELSTGSVAVDSCRTAWRDLVQELWELGLDGVAFRLRWELGMRSGWIARTERPPTPVIALASADEALLAHLPFAPARSVASAMADRIEAVAQKELAGRANDAARGLIRCFGRWMAYYGSPIDWHLNPVTRLRWDPGAHWSETLKDTGRVGDVKLTWEVGRFPHAYDLARAAALGAIAPSLAADVLAGQIEAFIEANPYGRGVHWASGQEVVIRLVAWLFAASALREESRIRAVLPAIARHLYEAGVHLERYFEYVRKGTNSNHLISEAFGLYQTGTLLPETPRSRRWVEMGVNILTEQATRQVYADGGYLMHSHNYHRAALHMYLLAIALRRHEGQPIPGPWQAAMGRTVDFLLAHQNPADGRLPNYGSNDGALVTVLSTCDYSDFRPFLQALSLAARGERLYVPGPWDEEAAWLLGPAALDAPLRSTHRASISFGRSGFHVIRGRRPDTFTSFRCGTIRDRFTQIDMLHVDVFWRGENVLVDSGTYLYSGPVKWLRHFTSGASHNTVTVDGRDQMVHFRRFKVLYLTTARLLRFDDAGPFAVAEGEHDGFRRHRGGCVHRRSVLHVKGDLWVVADRVQGAGNHSARLQWLAGPYHHRYQEEAGQLTLETPAGTFTVTVLEREGRPLFGDVVVGGESPPRGWVSRYYGEKVPSPSLAVVQTGQAPLQFVSVLAAGLPRVRVESDRWYVETDTTTVSFTLHEGRFKRVTALDAAGRTGRDEDHGG